MRTIDAVAFTIKPTDQWPTVRTLLADWVEDQTGARPDFDQPHGTIEHVKVTWRSAGDRALEVTVPLRLGDAWATTVIDAIPDRVRAQVRLQLGPSYELPHAADAHAPLTSLSRHLLRGVRAIDGGVRIAPDVTPVTIDTMPQLVEDLTAERRKLPAIVLAPSCPIDIDTLAARFAGRALLYKIEGGADETRRLSALLADHLGTFRRAMRVYWPGLTAESDGTPHRYWPADALERAPEACLRDLHDRLLTHLLSTWPPQTTVDRCHQPEPQPADDTPAGDLEEALERALATIAMLNRDADANVPDTTLEAVQRAAKDADDNAIVYLDAAYDSAAASSFSQPERALATLMALNDAAAAYHHDRLDGGFIEFFRQRGLRFAPRVSDIAANKWAHEYQVPGPDGTVELSPHLKLGSGPPDRCLRIYWSVDEDNRRLLVGHVGRHLTDTLTNG